MITQTPSPNKETPTRQPEPLRWLIPAALLLLFLSICCIGQVVIVILSPQNEASNLNLLSKDMADYSPWKIELKFPPIAPGAAAAQAADRATEAAQALLSPTPQLAADAPTSDVIVVAAPQNAPTTTPASALITPLPTVTPRPVALGPSETPEISTVPPIEQPPATLVAIELTSTETPRPLTSTPTPVGGNQPTHTSTPALSTATNTPRPPDTSTPTRSINTPTRVSQPTNTNTPVLLPTNTNTPVSPPTNTDTPVPPPTDTNTPVSPRNTNTPVPSTRTPTPVPPPTFTPTLVPTVPVTPTPTHTLIPTASNTTVPATPTSTLTFTPIPPTPTDTATPTPIPPTNTPTATPTPSCTAVPNTLTIVKFEANNTYTQGAQPIDFTICIINATSAPIQIMSITDTMPNTWQWTNLTCDMSGNANLACSPPGSPTGGSFAWGNQAVGQPLVMNPGDRIDLRIHGRYTAPGQQCNGPVTPPGAGGVGYEVTLVGGTVVSGNSACITVP